MSMCLLFSSPLAEGRYGGSGRGSEKELVSWDSSACKRDVVGICKTLRGKEGDRSLFHPPEELQSANRTTWSQV